MNGILTNWTRGFLTLLAREVELWRRSGLRGVFGPKLEATDAKGGVCVSNVLFTALLSTVQTAIHPPVRGADILPTCTPPTFPPKSLAANGMKGGREESAYPIQVSAERTVQRVIASDRSREGFAPSVFRHKSGPFRTDPYNSTAQKEFPWTAS